MKRVKLENPGWRREACVASHPPPMVSLQLELPLRSMSEYCLQSVPVIDHEDVRGCDSLRRDHMDVQELCMTGFRTSLGAGPICHQ